MEGVRIYAQPFKVIIERLLLCVISIQHDHCTDEERVNLTQPTIRFMSMANIQKAYKSYFPGTIRCSLQDHDRNSSGIFQVSPQLVPGLPRRS